MKTIIVADDHPITLNGIKTYLESLNYQVIGTYSDGEKAFEGVINLKPHFAILDLNMPEMNGLKVLEELRKLKIDTKIIIYTMYHESSFFERAKALQVNGYLLKDFAIQELETCLEKIALNETWFSPQLEDTLLVSKHDSVAMKLITLTASEKKILELIAEDHSTKKIADLLFISTKTVETHRTNIIKKLGLPNERNVLLRFALQNKIT
jgi:DNA-binding NarL/FixJ family response regulator